MSFPLYICMSACSARVHLACHVFDSGQRQIVRKDCKNKNKICPQMLLEPSVVTFGDFLSHR